MFLLVPAYPGCPGQTAIKWLLLLLLTQFCSSLAMSMVASFPIFLFLLLLLMFSLPTTAITIASVSLAAASVAPLTLYILTDSGRPTAADQVRAQLDVELVRTRGAKHQPWRRLRQPTTSTSRRLPSSSISSLALVE